MGYTMAPKVNRASQAGAAAQRWGAIAESLVDVALRQYAARGLLAWSPTYPEAKVLGSSGGVSKVILVEKGTPDRLFVSKSLGGRLAWLEVKTWVAKWQYTLSKSLHQYDAMLDYTRQGSVGYYLVLWRWQDTEEWRLHPVPVPNSESKTTRGLRFVRSSGFLVGSDDGWPDFLDALAGHALGTHQIPDPID